MVLDRPDSNFFNCPYRKKNPVQDPAQEHALHLVIMSLQSLLIWNTFSVFVHYIDIFEEHGPAAL